jgi:hypothetical protein
MNMKQINLVKKISIVETLKNLPKGEIFQCPYSDMPITSAKQASCRLHKTDGLSFRFSDRNNGTNFYTVEKI